jgi:hypothetical protein
VDPTGYARRRPYELRRQGLRRRRLEHNRRLDDRDRPNGHRCGSWPDSLAPKRYGSHRGGIVSEDGHAARAPIGCRLAPRGLSRARGPVRTRRRLPRSPSFDSRTNRPCSVVVLLAALVPLRLVVGGLWLGFVVEPAADAQYRASVGQQQTVIASVALAVMGVGLVALWRSLPETILHAAALTSITVVLGLGISAFAHVQAQRDLNLFEPQLDAISSFVPPAGARLSSTIKVPSDPPSATRYWLMPGAVDEVCRDADASFREWIPLHGNVLERRRPSVSCFLQAMRGDQLAELTIVPSREESEGVQLGLKVAPA